MLNTFREGLHYIVGFVGQAEKSPNGVFTICFSGGHLENDIWINGELALIQDKKLLFKKIIERPNDCKVSNEGIVLCCDWLASMDLSGCFMIFDRNGVELMSIKTNANLGNCEISRDSKIAIVETHNASNEDGNKIFILDIPNKKLIAKIERPVSFTEAKIDTEKQRIGLFDNRGLEYEIDFKGNQTNPKEYYNQIIGSGRTHDVLLYFQALPKELRLADHNYLDILKKASSEKNHNFDLGNIYREIGEVYVFQDKKELAIEYWEKAVNVNPKVGVKRRLIKLKSSK